MEIGAVYKKEISVFIANNRRLVIKEGDKLKIIKDCYDEGYMHEVTNYFRKGLIEKKLRKDDIIEVVGYWKNFYGGYIKCKFNNEIYDILPKNISNL